MSVFSLSVSNGKDWLYEHSDVPSRTLWPHYKSFFYERKKLLNLRKQNGNIHVGSLIESVISLMQSHYIVGKPT